MHKTIYILLIVFAGSFFACDNAVAEKNSLPKESTTLVLPDSVPNQVPDASTIAETSLPPEDSSVTATEPEKPNKAWKTSQFIVSCPPQLREELSADIDYYREEWKDVPNPFLATYKGNSIGDYFHLDFVDETGRVYDFGFGANDFGSIVLYGKDKDYEDNPNYVGKRFKVNWEWKVSSFPCCSGEYEAVEAYMPSITGLELAKADKK